MRWTRPCSTPIATLLTTSLIAAVAADTAWAQPRSGQSALVDATLERTIKPPRGFIDAPFVVDGSGSRLLYVVADAGYMADMHIVDLVQGGLPLGKLALNKFTNTPVQIRLIGDRYFVVSRPEGKQAKAAVIDSGGAIKNTFGPADDIVLTERDGALVVATYSVIEKPARKKGPVEFHHTVQLYSMDGAKRMPRPRVLVTNAKGESAKLDFRIAYWADGYTRAVGIKGGRWDASANQRSPDQEAWYDMVTGVFSKRIDIKDVMAHAYLLRDWANHHNEREFIAVKRDNSGLELVTPSGRKSIGLAEPFQRYDFRSLQYQPSWEGRFFFTIKIDPVNPAAAARKKADPEYLDLYEYRSGQPKAVRRARILLSDKRRMSWYATDEHWIVVPRMLGFDRGGKELRIYKLGK
ncbi:MAG: hypothetical protein AAGC55_14655 [Myxococcota bacterium]